MNRGKMMPLSNEEIQKKLEISEIILLLRLQSMLINLGLKAISYLDKELNTPVISLKKPKK